MIIYKLYKESLSITAHRQRVDDKKIDFYSFDQQTAKIIVQIKSPGDGKALEAVQDVLIALERGGKKAVHNMKVEDYDENLVSFVLPDNIISQSGSFLCGIYLDYGNNKSLDVGYFRINLKQSLIDKDLPAMEQFYVQSFEELKGDIIQRSSDLQEIIDGIDTDVADKLQTLDDLAEDYAQKAADLEATYAPRLTEVTAQLAQTQQDFNAAVGAITEDSEVAMARNSTISGTTYNILGQRIDDLELSIMTEAGHIPTDYSKAPGSKVLVGGNKDNGFYGFVQPHEFGKIENNPEGNKNISASNLALAIGLTNGVAINEATAWMKFSRGGEIYLVPVKPLRRSVTWDAIYRQGAVYGNGGIGVNPPGGRVGPRLSVNGSGNAFVIEPDSEGGWLRSGAVTAAVGDTIVARGFSNSDNNGEFTVLSVTDTNIVVDGNLFDEAAGNKNASVYKKGNEVTQNRDVVIGGNRYRVQLLKGAARDPLDSYLDSDRGMVGPNSEWNNLILPLHERARLQNWRYPTHAGGTEDWGIGLTDADLITHHTEGLGSYTWCQ